MRSTLTLRILLAFGCSVLLWRHFGDCLHSLVFAGAACEHLHPSRRTQRHQMPVSDSVFQTLNGAMATLSNHFEKISDHGVLTAASKDWYSSGSHAWRVTRLAGIGIRTRIGVCLGNVSWETNPTDVASDSSFWFYEETSGTLNERVANKPAERLLNSASGKVPFTMYTGDELALILDCDQHKLYFFWPSGEEGVIEGLPAGPLKFFVSVQDRGDSWQVTKEAVPEPETVYKDNSWIMQQYRKLPGF
eukprot:TRINITY_DN37198_c0_g1_i1.p1 TRINITY_DN37198_c0_g1~~TRINITY_DN37198_c0_g1_i1.p1  ORF type:complete len:247 (-),score=38.73 TRINITY_DN37198_c0_g1_i1:93-833(-)